MYWNRESEAASWVNSITYEKINGDSYYNNSGSIQNYKDLRQLQKISFQFGFRKCRNQVFYRAKIH